MQQPLLYDVNWVKLNEAELAILCLEAPGLKHAMLAFCAQFGLEMLVVTCGAKGDDACNRQQHFVTGAFLKNDTAYYLYLCCLHVF